MDYRPRHARRLRTGGNHATGPLPFASRGLMTLPIFVINLDRSPERWERISRSGGGLDLRRVAGIQGSEIAREGWRHVAPERFMFSHGRILLPGEYGCYQSHLLALRTIVEQDIPAAVVAEDDVVLVPDLAARAAALLGASAGGVMKLFNHRVRAFRRWGTSALGDAFGRCAHGPLGSAACYAVTNAAARALLERLRVMWLPWDIALERGWDTQVATFTSHLPLVRIGPDAVKSTIARTYKVSKLPPTRRLPAAAFRAEDYLRRAAYARWG